MKQKVITMIFVIVVVAGWESELAHSVDLHDGIEFAGIEWMGSAILPDSTCGVVLQNRTGYGVDIKELSIQQSFAVGDTTFFASDLYKLKSGGRITIPLLPISYLERFVVRVARKHGLDLVSSYEFCPSYSDVGCVAVRMEGPRSIGYRADTGTEIHRARTTFITPIFVVRCRANVSDTKIRQIGWDKPFFVRINSDLVGRGGRRME